MRLFMQRTFDLYINEETWDNMTDVELQAKIEQYNRFFDNLEKIARQGTQDVRFKLAIN